MVEDDEEKYKGSKKGRENFGRKNLYNYSTQYIFHRLPCPKRPTNNTNFLTKKCPPPLFTHPVLPLPSILGETRKKVKKEKLSIIPPSFIFFQ